MANHAFSLAIKIVRQDSSMASAIFEGLSSISTTSAASMAASLPKAPIAIPTSARANTGASLIPSPTKAIVSSVFFSLMRRSMWLTLSAGSNSAKYSVTLVCSATCSTTSLLSPLNITVLLTPNCFKASIAFTASAFSWSEITIWPAYSPSIATWTIVPTWLVQRLQVGIVIPSVLIKRLLPTLTFWLLTVAVIPCPAVSCISSTVHLSCSFAYAIRRARAIGWVE